ncbi:hypothetical protein Tco_1566090 [Tanacetum coccineum]
MMVQAQAEVGEGLTNPTDPHHTPTTSQPSISQPQKKQKPRRKQRKGIEIPSSSGEPIANKAANEEHVPTYSNDPLLIEVTIVDETQERNGDNLMFDTGVLDNKEVFLEQDITEKEVDMAKKDVSTADLVTTADEVVTTTDVEVSTARPTEATIINELTLAQTLIEIKSAKPKVKGIVFNEPVESTTTTTTPISLPKPPQDKGKEKMIESQKPLKKKYHIMFDKEVA